MKCQSQGVLGRFTILRILRHDVYYILAMDACLTLGLILLGLMGLSLEDGYMKRALFSIGISCLLGGIYLLDFIYRPTSDSPSFFLALRKKIWPGCGCLSMFFSCKGQKICCELKPVFVIYYSGLLWRWW